MADFENILLLAEKKRKETHRWWKLLWTIHCWIHVLTYCIMLAVPFGLAILLYVNNEDGRIINIIILTISALALIFDVVCRVLKIEKRSILLRSVNYKLETIIAKYKDGHITEQNFLKIMDAVLNDYSKEGEI